MKTQQLQQELRTFERFFELSLDLLCIGSFDGKFVKVNKSWERALGWSRKELIGQLWLDFVHPNDRQSTIDAGEKLFHGQNIQGFENRYRCKDGSYRWLSWDSFPERESNQVIAVARDITSEKKNQQALADSEERFRNSINQSPFAVQIHRTDGKMIFVNPAWGRLWQIRRYERFYGKLNVLEDKEAAEVGLQRAFRKALTGKTVKVSAISYYPVKTSRPKPKHWINAVAYPLTDNTGQIRNIIIVIEDISDKIKTEQALKTSESLFRQIWESSIDGMRLLDDQGKIIQVNDAFCKITGMTKEKLLGKPLSVIYATDHHEAMLKTFRERFEKGAIPPQLERKFKLKNGREVWFALSNSYMRDEFSRLSLLSIFRDVSETKRFETALRESENLYKTLIETMPDAVQVVGLDGKIKYASRGAVKNHGCESADELIGQHILETCHMSTRGENRMQLEELIRTGKMQNLEVLSVRKDGSTFYSEVNAALLEDSEGNAKGIISTSRDITERKRHQEELRKVQSLLTAAIEQSPAGILIADAPDVRIRMANAAALGIRGDSPVDLTNIPAEIHPRNWQTYHPDGKPFKAEDLPLSRAVLKGETTRNVDALIRRSDGEDRWVLANAAPVHDSAGNIIAGVVVFMDVTELKQAERELQVRSKFENLLSEISTQFINIESDALDKGIEKALRKVCNLIHADSGYVLNFNHSNKQTALTHLHRARTFHLKKKEITCLAQGLVDSMPLHNNDIQLISVSASSKKNTSAARAILKQAQLEAAIHLPLVYKGKISGCLGFVCKTHPHQWTDTQNSMLRMLGQIFVNALERKDHDLELNERLSRIERQEVAIVKMANHQTMTSGDFNKAARYIARTVAEAMNVDRTGIWLLDESEDTLENRVMHTPLNPKSAERSVLLMEELPVYYDALRQTRSIDAGDAGHESRLKELKPTYLEKNGIVSKLDSSIRVSGQVIGVVTIEQCVRKRFWHMDEITFSAEVADQVAQAYLNSKRRQAEIALKESEEKYRLLIEQQTDLVVKVDADGHFLFVSPSYCELFDKKEYELIGKHFLQFIHEDDRKKTMREMQKLYTPPHTCYVEQRALTKYGWKWLAWSDKAILDQNDQVVEIIGVGRDITAKREAEQALRISEEKYRHIFENIQDIYYETSVKGVILEMSPSIKNLSGYDRKHLLGKNVDILYKDVGQRNQLLTAILENKQLADFDITLIDKDGQEHICSINARLLIDEHGGPGRIVGSMRDKTESKKLEVQLQQAQKMEAVGTLAGGIAHDFNNLLTAIIGGADLAMVRLNENDPSYTKFTDIREAGLRASNLTSQLLAFSRKQVLEASIVRVNKVISDLERMLKSMVRDDIEIHMYLESETDTIKADKTQLEQVLINLALNASDAMPKGGKIIFETHAVYLDKTYSRTHPTVKPGNYIQIVVTDTGHGMDKETIEKIFDPFFTTKGIGKGTGLGLAMVYGIIKQHGGNIWVYSEENIGTTFKIYLPLQEAEYTEEIKETDRSELQGGEETILVVEDEEIVKNLVCNSLSNLGYQVLKAKDVFDALELARSRKAELKLLITDMVMPGMNGRQLYDEISGICPDLKVIYMSGYTNNVISEEGFVEDGVHFLQKPFVIGELSRKVREVLNE